MVFHGSNNYFRCFTAQLDVICDSFLCSDRVRGGPNGPNCQGDAEYLTQLSKMCYTVKNIELGKEGFALLECKMSDLMQFHSERVHYIQYGLNIIVG